jgi:hypothetical protein
MDGDVLFPVQQHSIPNSPCRSRHERIRIQHVCAPDQSDSSVGAGGGAIPVFGKRNDRWCNVAPPPISAVSRALQNADAERRASIRFPITLKFHYTALGPIKPVRLGTGRTIDMSSSGLRFTADTSLQIGQKMVVHIDWPALLPGDIKLQLVVSGLVVRTSGTEVALRIVRHDFRNRVGEGSPH